MDTKRGEAHASDTGRDVTEHTGEWMTSSKGADAGDLLEALNTSSPSRRGTLVKKKGWGCLLIMCCECAHFLRCPAPHGAGRRLPGSWQGGCDGFRSHLTFHRRLTVHSANTVMASS